MVEAALARLLDDLSLQALQPLLEDEAILTIPILRSMGAGGDPGPPGLALDASLRPAERASSATLRRKRPSSNIVRAFACVAFITTLATESFWFDCDCR